MNFSEKTYVFLCSFFCVIIIVSNLIYQKFIYLPILSFYTFELSAGAVLYPLSFILSDLIAEFYGKDKANFCVKLTLSINILIVLIITLIDILPATKWSKVDDNTFHTVFGFHRIAFIGSLIACYIAQSIDIVIYIHIKKLTKNRFLGLRNNISTSISLLIDTIIVISFMTFFGALPKDQLVNLIFNSYIFKLFFTICNTPFFYISASLIKFLIYKKEKTISI